MINGVINVYKEKGYTSHDVVAKLRGILGQKKIGHTGTLDPDAEGVLPVCLGKATKLCDMITEKNKTYEAVLLLGKETDTQDTSGTVLKESEVHVTPEEVTEAILGFIGDYEQIPPMYSALKVNGKKLYELARQGIEVERKARSIKILDIRILSMDLPRVKMRVTCSKGTYIRTLLYDIGRKLGCGGCMEELLRTGSGIFTLENSLKLEEIQHLKETDELEQVILPIDHMFRDYPKAVIKKEYENLVYNGNPFLISQCNKALDCQYASDRPVRVYDEEGQFIGIFKYVEERHYFKPVKMFLA